MDGSANCQVSNIKRHKLLFTSSDSLIFLPFLPRAKILSQTPDKFIPRRLGCEESSAAKHNAIFCSRTPRSLQTAKCDPSFSEGSLIWITQFACQPLTNEPEDIEQEGLVRSDREKENLCLLLTALGFKDILQTGRSRIRSRRTVFNHGAKRMTLMKTPGLTLSKSGLF